LNFLNVKKIIAVIDATFAVAERKPTKKFRLVRDSIPMQHSSEPLELTSQLGAGNLVGLSGANPYKPEFFHAFFSQPQKLHL